MTDSIALMVKAEVAATRRLARRHPGKINNTAGPKHNQILYMSLRLSQRLSFKLTRTSLVVVLLLGLVATFGQIYLDFSNENKNIETHVNDILIGSLASAQRAVHTLDTTLADEVVKGLVTYPFISTVEILDEDNNLMARRENSFEHSKTEALTRKIRSSESFYRLKLVNQDSRYEGELFVVVNNDTLLSPLYARALSTFASGLIRNIILGLILAYLFNQLLTRPLLQLASNITAADSQTDTHQRVKHVDHHRDDELGFIINSANRLIERLEKNQNDLAQREDQLRIILDASPNQVFAINNNGDFVFANIAIADFYEADHDTLTGRNYYSMHRKCSPTEAEEIFTSVKNTEESGKIAKDVEQHLTDLNGVVHVMNMTLMPFTLYGNNCILIIANDISARVAAEERVERLAYYDALTSLPNRNQLYEILVEHIDDTRRNDNQGAVLFIDIDDFKRINDTLGHSVGDELLLVLSNKMRGQLRSSETLARLGGDEFVLSIPNISNDQEIAADHAANLAERLLKIISAPIELSGQFFSIGASIGISTYPGIASDIEQLLRFADTAMYQAKAAGRSCYRVFEAPMAEEAQTRVRLEGEIRQAIQHQQFRFYLQPLIDASTGQVCGAEALIRWEHPVKGMIMPNEFIPFLEQSPMVSQVGGQIIDQVCGFLAAGLETELFHEGFRISVNVSATEFFEQNFVEHVRATLERHDLPGKFLEIEITESVALDGLDSVIAKMLELQNYGITFALDDFGTGYSSLNYLKQLPVDKIKIDKTFIDGVPHNKQDTALVSSVIDIAENLSLKVVVEGIENKVQAEYFGLVEHVIAQGYYFDAPMPPANFIEKYFSQKEIPNAYDRV